jgi:membrane protein YdbS with pleckstrin-like domain
MSLRRTLLDWLRVPHEPSAPEGDRDIKIFRAAPNYFWYRVLGWINKNLWGAFALGMALFFAARLPTFVPDGGIPLGPFHVSENTVLFWLAFFEFVGIAGFIAQAIGSLILLRLDFEQRWYIVTDRSLRIREGLLKLHEKTMTFANVQHVAIRQGPLQRLLGIADLEVRTAGGKASEEEASSRTSDLHVAYFHGIANPATVRNAIRERLRAHRDAGLGDPDDTQHHQTHPLLPAAIALATEARRVREAVVSGQ